MNITIKLNVALESGAEIKLNQSQQSKVETYISDLLFTKPVAQKRKRVKTAARPWSKYEKEDLEIVHKLIVDEPERRKEFIANFARSRNRSFASVASKLWQYEQSQRKVKTQ